MHDEILFWQYDWFAMSEAQKRAARSEASQLSEVAFGERDIPEIAAELCEKYSMVPPTLDTDNITVKKRDIEFDVSHDRMQYFGDYGPHYVKGTGIDVRVPFSGDALMFKLKPTTWSLSVPHGRVEGNFVVFTISVTNNSTEAVKAEIDERVAEIKKWLNYQSESAGGFSDELSRIVVEALEARKSKLIADKELIAGLGFKVE